MNIKEQYLAFFSATNNTRSLVRDVAKQTGLPTAQEYDIAKENLAGKKSPIVLQSNTLLIVGVPSYAGRVPAIALDTLNKIKGQNTPAIIVCTYGNRDYDDTLLELHNLLVCNGFKVISAGAFVGVHSIFSQVGVGRPNEGDKMELKSFVHTTMQLIESLPDINSCKGIELKGNYPYKKIGKIPLRPKGDSKCDQCGTCVHLCPTNAIPLDNPKRTDKKKCISCARCITVCPQKSRAFRGLLYRFVEKRFVKEHSATAQPNVLRYADVD